MLTDPNKIGVLNELLANSDQPRKQIAENLQISESYVSKIVKELAQYDPYINRFTVEINYKKAGYDAHAVTLIKLQNVDREDVHSIAKRIAEIDVCIEVFTALGDWDIYIRWLCRSNAEIQQSIEEVIDSKFVADTVTLPLGVQYKRVIGPKVALVEHS